MTDRSEKGFEVLECRAAVGDGITTLYVLLGMDPETESVGGWWRKQIPSSVQAIPFLASELARGGLDDGWEPGAPPGNANRGPKAKSAPTRDAKKLKIAG